MVASYFIAATSLATLASAAPFFSRHAPISLTKRQSSGPAVVTGSLAISAINDEDGVGAGASTYTFFQGDGSEAAGWPSQSSWASFNEMFAANTQAMNSSCVNNKFSDTNDSPAEIAAIKSAIESVATSTKVDHRFILAVIMQESKGCVRVNTTISPDGTVTNPGLMQDHDGTFGCNTKGNVSVPCSDDQITGMITDGTAGTTKGPGLAGLLNQAAASAPAAGNGTSSAPAPTGTAPAATGTATAPIVSSTAAAAGGDAQAFYIAARLYNSGSNPTGDLGAPGATRCYASDIANRLSGWTDFGEKSKCTLDATA